MREHFKQAYHRIGRWLLSAAIALGAFIGWFYEIPEVATSALVAVLQHFHAGLLQPASTRSATSAQRQLRLFLTFRAATVAVAVAVAVAFDAVFDVGPR